MRDPGYASLQAYEHALTQLQDLEKTVYDHLKGFFAVDDGGAQPDLRRLAFLEGLRRERDMARETAMQAEVDLVNRLLANLG